MKIHERFSVIYCADALERKSLLNGFWRHYAWLVSKARKEWRLKRVYSCVRLKFGESYTSNHLTALA